MAWRNIWRNPRRSILTISAIAFASVLLVFMLSWQFGSYDTMINSAVKIHTGHLQVQARGYNDKKSIRLVVSDPAAVGNVLDDTPEVAAHTCRATAFSLVSSSERTYGVMVVGIDPVREAGVSTLKKMIRQGSYLSEDDTDQALVGELLARNLKVGLGDELVVLGQGRDGSVAATVVKVKGIYRSGMDEFDRSSINIPLKNFQDVYAMRGAVHEVVALGKSLEYVPEIKKAVAAGIEDIGNEGHLVVLDWMELMPGLIEAIQMDLYSGFIFYLILIVVVAFSILNTFLMAIFERTREFGVLLAIGTTPGRLSKLLLIESTIMTIAGIVVGIIAGSLVTGYFQVHGIVISGTSELMRQFGLPERMYPQLSMLSASIGPAAVLVITFLTALYPALKVRRLRPVEAMAGI
ncbi:MAG: ABC transporter permease [Deltaproteobacteria bacterium]|nr:ABC transporter permease [Deltaproteobacteria bacterium]MBW2650614.1 ABC transporter permease [Deltaproteobacteria bacterium]